MHHGSTLNIRIMLRSVDTDQGIGVRGRSFGEGLKRTRLEMADFPFTSHKEKEEGVQVRTRLELSVR
jgi:hypothetical protein